MPGPSAGAPNAPPAPGIHFKARLQSNAFMVGDPLKSTPRETPTGVPTVDNSVTMILEQLVARELQVLKGQRVIRATRATRVYKARRGHLAGLQTGVAHGAMRQAMRPTTPSHSAARRTSRLHRTRMSLQELTPLNGSYSHRLGPLEQSEQPDRKV